jgi:hypothetical protein
MNARHAGWIVLNLCCLAFAVLFLAILVEGSAMRSDDEQGLVDRHRMRRVETGTQALILYRADPAP